MKVSLLLCVVVISSITLACSGAQAPPARHAEPEAPRRVEQKQAAAELSAIDVVTTLRGNETDLRRCFFANPGARGFVRFSWSVDAAGLVHGVKREYSTLGDRRVESCLADRLAELKFGELQNAASARWAFVFQLVENPEAGIATRRRKRKTRKSSTRTTRPASRSTRARPARSARMPSIASSRAAIRCSRAAIATASTGTTTWRVRSGCASSWARTAGSRASPMPGSDLSDRQVVDCVAEAFFSLRFPEPKNGHVQVLYRIHFTASGR